MAMTNEYSISNNLLKIAAIHNKSSKGIQIHNEIWRVGGLVTKVQGSFIWNKIISCSIAEGEGRVLTRRDTKFVDMFMYEICTQIAAPDEAESLHSSFETPSSWAPFR